MKSTQKILAMLVTGGLLLVSFIPFYVANSMYFPFIAGKGFAFRILIEIVFGLYVILATMDPVYRPKNSWITKAVGAFILVMFVADIFSANPYKSIWSNYERMEGFVILAHLGLFYIVMTGMWKKFSDWLRFFNVTIAASVIMSVYGILQLAGKITVNQGGVRLDATFGNAAYLAIYLVFHIFLCLFLLVQKRPAWQKWTYGAIAVLETAILYFTATRGAILGLIGGLIIAAVIVAFREKENAVIRKSARIGLAAVLVLVVGFIALRGTPFIQKSPVLSRFSSLSWQEAKTQGRYFVWPMALKGAIERPILGWGQESFNFVFNKYYDPRMYGQEQWFDRTHNVILDWLIAGGLLGLLAYLSMFAGIFYYLWRRENSLTLSEKSVLTGMITAYLFHNLFVFDNLGSYILFFAVLAYVHTVGTVRKEASGTFATKIVPEKIVTSAVLPVVLVATALAVYFVNVPAIKANTALIQAITPQQSGGLEKNAAIFRQVFDYNSFGSSEALEQLIQISAQVAQSAQVPDTVKQEFYELTKSRIEKKIAATPHDARYLVFAGSFFNQYGQYDTALEYLTRAAAESPKKQTILFELGSSYIGKRDYAKALETFKKAYELDPAFTDAKILYAVGAIYNRDSALAGPILQEIDPNIILNDNRFLHAYADVGDYQSVITILSLRLQNDPNNLQYKLSLASAYATIGQKQKAVELIREIIAAEPAFKEQGEAYILQIQGS